MKPIRGYSPTIKPCLKKNRKYIGAPSPIAGLTASVLFMLNYIGAPSPFAGLTASVLYALDEAIDELWDALVECSPHRRSSPSKSLSKRVVSIESKMLPTRRSSSSQGSTKVKRFNDRDRNTPRKQTITWAPSLDDSDGDTNSTSDDADSNYYPSPKQQDLASSPECQTMTKRFQGRDETSTSEDRQPIVITTKKTGLPTSSVAKAKERIEAVLPSCRNPVIYSTRAPTNTSQNEKTNKANYFGFKKLAKSPKAEDVINKKIKDNYTTMQESFLSAPKQRIGENNKKTNELSQDRRRINDTVGLTK